MQAHLDMGLPLIDIGCGNGRFARRLAPYVPSVLGVDQAANAIARAVNESGDVPNVTFRVLDAAAGQLTRLPPTPGSRRRPHLGPAGTRHPNHPPTGAFSDTGNGSKHSQRLTGLS